MPTYFAHCRQCETHSERSDESMAVAQDRIRMHESRCPCRKCPHCAKVLPSQTALNIHMKYAHKALACPECFKMFPTVGDFTKHVREQHETADKAILLTRDGSVWVGSTLAGETKFQLDQKDFVNAGSTTPPNVGDLKDRIADVINENRHTITLLENGEPLPDHALLERLSTVVMKLNALLEKSQKLQALQEMCAGTITKSGL